jgi:hypothetical protein
MNPQHEDLSDIQRLIRLKRYEQPPEGFTEQFLTKFAVHQRNELNRKSLWTLVSERITEALSAWSTPQWASAAMAACLLVAGVTFALKGGNDSSMPRGQSLPVKHMEDRSWRVSPLIYAQERGTAISHDELNGLLLGTHFSGGFQDVSPEAVAQQPTGKHAPFEVEPMFQVK